MMYKHKKDTFQCSALIGSFESPLLVSGKVFTPVLGSEAAMGICSIKHRVHVTGLLKMFGKLRASNSRHQR